jgi:hypothetical protein
VIERVDFRRFTVLLATVDALLTGGRLSLTALGRALASGAAAKHRIKRVDRFLGNPNARDERLLYYAAVARRLLGQSRRPIVLLDWTKTGKTHWSLVAAIAAKGRSVPVYGEVHDESRYGNRSVQHRFLDTLARLLPPTCKPVIVADAGFKTPFFRVVEEMGWDFVIRLRGNCSLKRAQPRRHLRFKRAFSMAVEEPRSLGQWIPYAVGHWSSYRIILGARPVKSKRCASAEFYKRRALEPWLLATTLRSELPSCIVAIYAKRMQIEETFRDAKNPRFGWAFDHASSRSADRLEALLLIAALALVATVLAGAAVEDRGLARLHQANTITSRRVLSLVRLGTYALQSDAIDVGVRHIIAKRVLLEIYVQRPLQQSLPFTRLRRGKWW